MPLQLVGQQALDQRFDRGLPKMEEVPGIVERKPVFHVRTTKSSDLTFTLHNLVGYPAQVIGRAESRQSSPDNHNHTAPVLSVERAVTDSARMAAAPPETFTRVSATAATPRHNSVTPLNSMARS